MTSHVRMSELRLVVSGSRYGRPDVWSALESWLAAFRDDRPVRLYHGCAPGVDEQARCWGMRAGVQEERFPANWSRGKKAGPERNIRMVRAAGGGAHMLGFPGPKSVGTWHCYRVAANAELCAVIVDVGDTRGFIEELRRQMREKGVI